ncbi:hypothetical protein [Sphingomonas sp.]|uniref:hypothetical protein n=1 Tax=Sphingomonas sp. TaxID=28214 RepID=UPI001D7C6424|nr:hypothetical protein [Sphingomonas sp.]MBX9797813.1 hypothetical protein [Sphingomonas sp.]
MTDWRRRDLIAAMAAAGALGATRLQAQTKSRDPLSVLDQFKLPDLLRELVPGKTFDTVLAIASLLQLEREARDKNLPASPLAFDTDQPLPTSTESYYTAALPRLVTLIDRSGGGADDDIADRAATLLADLNDTEHVVPDAFKGDVPRPARNRDFTALKDEYVSYFSSTEVRPEYARICQWYLQALEQFRPRYEAVASDTGVPWYFIGAIHGLEASFNFRAHLHNGDAPLTQRTRQVPAGRPKKWMPPSSWEASARDALTLMGFAGKVDWTLSRMLYRFEAYNGFGYRSMGVATPYLWAFSNHYERGKFVADGRWNPSARSQQCGAAVLIRMLADAGVVVVTPA